MSRGRAVLAGVVVAMTAGGGTAVALLRSGDNHPTRPVPAAQASTAQVTRTDLRTTQQFSGVLDYPPVPALVAATGGRAYTRLPAPGDVLRQGQPVYEVDGVGVPLLYGARPAWRDLAPGVPPGADVAQLNTALAALGYLPAGAGDRHYRARTAAAVRRWQRARGVPVTGTVALGQVLFAPGPVRVQAVHASLGTPPQPGAPLLDVTGTAHVVDLSVPVDQAFLVHPRDHVDVTMPDGRTRVPGTVQDISPVATQPSTGDNSRAPTPVVDITVELADPGRAAAYTTAPITVAVTVAHADGVLAVPVTALLAQPGGGYAVAVLDGGVRREVPVQPGLFADTLVEVTGAGLAEGETVEVPAS